MSAKNKDRLIIAILAIAVIIVLVWIALSGGQTRTLKLAWDYYPAYGSKDCSFLLIHTQKYNELDSMVSVTNVDVSKFDSTYTTSVDKGFRYEIYMMAVDSSGNASVPSDTVGFELFNPKRVENLTGEVK